MVKFSQPSEIQLVTHATRQKFLLKRLKEVYKR